VLPRLVASLAWFWHSVCLPVESLALSEAGEQAVYEHLLPGLYGTAAAPKAATAAEKKRLRGLARSCLERAWSTGGVLCGLADDLKEVAQRVCAEGVRRFVRSSSCVEGRNGQLSLHHHGSPALSLGKSAWRPPVDQQSRQIALYRRTVEIADRNPSVRVASRLQPCSN
jgi:hypothetical protein